MKNYLLVILTILILYSCKKEKFPEVEAIPTPKAKIIEGPGENELISINNVTFSWKGNGDTLSKFSWKLESENQVYFNWSNWSTGKSVSLNYLDDGKYTFSVNEMFSNGFEQDTLTTRIFFVDAVQGPTLYMKKQYNETSVNGSVGVFIGIEDITDFMGGKIVFEYDKTYLNLISIKKTDFLYSQDINNILFEYKSSENNNKIRIELNIICLGQDFNGLSGSGTAAILDLKALKKGKAEINFIKEGCELRNIDNDEIIILQNEIRNTTINIK